MASISRGLVGTQHVPKCFWCRQAIETSDEGILRCGFCPKSYHNDCLPDLYKPSIISQGPRWGCPSHKCQCDLTTSAIKKGEKMLACVTCPRAYCPKCVGQDYVPLYRSQIWDKMSRRFVTIQCGACAQSGVDLDGFISSEVVPEEQSESGSQQANTSLRERIAEKIQKYKLKQEDVAKAISFSAGTLSLYLKGDVRKRGWSNLEEKLASYFRNYESESNSDQERNGSNISNDRRIAIPRTIFENGTFENLQQEDAFVTNDDLHPEDYMVTENYPSTHNLTFPNDENDDSNYPYSPWPYADVTVPNNTNQVQSPQSSHYSHSKDDTEFSTGSLNDGSYSY